MKERRLIFLDQSPGKKFETKEAQNPADKENTKEDQSKSNVHDKYEDVFPFNKVDTCSGDVCKIPSGSPATASNEKVELNEKWTKATVENIDSIAKQGDIILIGASWCTGCTKAKEDLPKEYSSSRLLYIDYDDDADKTDEKFQLDGSLPGKFICKGNNNGKTLYTKLS